MSDGGFFVICNYYLCEVSNGRATQRNFNLTRDGACLNSVFTRMPKNMSIVHDVGLSDECEICVAFVQE